MRESVPRLATIGEVASFLEVPIHRVQYVLRTRSHIRPTAVAGGSRCFDDHAIEQIAMEIQKIDKVHGGNHAQA